MPPKSAPTGPATSALKFAADDKTRLTGLLLPFGGSLRWKGDPLDHPGRDSYGEYFSPRTEFALSWGQKAGGWPLLYHHGRDPSVDIIPVGRINSIEIRDADPKTGALPGGWMEAQLDEQSAYFDAITSMVEKGKLFLSSGAMGHLIQVNKKSGEVLRFPVVEGSLTPTPACLLATVDLTTAQRHFKSAGIDLPHALDNVPADPDTSDPDILTGARALDELHAIPALDAADALLAARSWRSAQTSEDVCALPPGALLASVYDPGDRAEGENARAHRSALAGTVLDTLPDEHFLYVESGGTKDAQGLTTPRHLRHFPYRAAATPTGEPDPVEAAVFRTLAPDAVSGAIMRSALPDDIKRRVRAHALRLADAGAPAVPPPDPAALTTDLDTLLGALSVAPAKAADAAALRSWVLAHITPSAPPPPPARDPLDGRGGCYEERRQAVSDTLNPPSVIASAVRTDVLATWDDRVIAVRAAEDETPTYWDIRYHIDHGEAILDEQTMTDPYTPAVRASKLDAGSFSLDLSALTRHAARATTRTKDLIAERRSEHRHLSQRNIDAVAEARGAIAALADALGVMVTEQQEHVDVEAKANALRSHAEQKQRLRLLALSRTETPPTPVTPPKKES